MVFPKERVSDILYEIVHQLESQYLSAQKSFFVRGDIEAHTQKPYR